MNKNKLKKLIALCVACAGAFSLAGCANRGDGHVHSWTGYRSDGANGHYRLSTCLDHATVREETQPHDGDTCSKCGYVKDAGDAVPVTKVEITGKNTVKAGGKITLTAIVTPSDATAKTVSWTIIQGSDCAEIDENGVLTGKAVGAVVVKATAGGVSDTFDVTIIESSGQVPVTGVVLDKSTLELTAGDTATLVATVKPEDADDQTVSWSSDNAAATVKNGVVTAVSAGTANITVTTTDGGWTATCKVTVKELEPGKDPTTPGDGMETPPPAEIKPVEGGPTITKASAGELETAYVEWTAAENADWYNVYVSPEGADSWTQLDAPLIRQYQGYYRADALGLAAGTYDMKVVPVDASGKEATEYAAPAEKITVYAHERMGYAFTGGNVPGAYNLDGTLKDGAQVVYVTSETAKTVTATVNGAKITGFQSILDAYQKGSSDPIAFRLVGKVSASDLDGMSSSAQGLQIKGKTGNPAENITLEGVGHDGTIMNFGMLLRNCKNVEVRNLGILNCMDDGISIDTDNSNLWVHNNDIFYGKGGSGDKAKGDGALDTKNSNYLTHSYNHFWDCGKCNLQGMKDAQEADTHVTYHHNWYDHSDSRHPRIRSARAAHIFNNYFDGNAKYGVGAAMKSCVFVENNYFRSTTKMMPMIIGSQANDIKSDGGSILSGEDGGMIKAYGNKFDCSKSNLALIEKTKDSPDTLTSFDCYTAATRTEKVPASVKAIKGGATYNNFDTADDMYEYTVDTPDVAREKVMRYAGRVDGGDLKWTFDDSKEDANYSVIPELKAAILAYDDKIVKIGK